MTFANCLHLPRLLACILARWLLLGPQISFLHVLFLKLWNFSTWQPFFLAGREFIMSFSEPCSSTPFCSKLASSWLIPPLLQQPHHHPYVPAATGFVFGYRFKTICVPVSFHYVHPFVSSGLQESWEEGLGLLFPVGLRLLRVKLAEGWEDWSLLLQKQMREQEQGGSRPGVQWTRAVVLGRTAVWDTDLFCDFGLGFDSLSVNVHKHSASSPRGPVV